MLQALVWTCKEKVLICSPIHKHSRSRPAVKRIRESTQEQVIGTEGVAGYLMLGEARGSSRPVLVRQTSCRCRRRPWRAASASTSCSGPRRRRHIGACGRRVLQAEPLCDMPGAVVRREQAAV